MLHVNTATVGVFFDVGSSSLAVSWVFGCFFFNVLFAQIICRRYILCCSWRVLHTFQRERFAL